MSAMGSRPLPGRTTARTSVMGTMMMPTVMQESLAMVRAASMPMVKSESGKRLERTSLTAFAKGMRPSMRICIILGVRTMAADVDMPMMRMVSTGSPASSEIMQPMMKPRNMGSPRKPKRSWTPSGEMSILLMPGMMSQSLFRR